ncbi:tRNA lysidine(34) synthetase TilS [Acinetobacter bereziniae]|uniref:tRNA lysidine(34) synthetase TilS n=1 Tax=Acinetobacter bereziniae TaxID=106648 RepID=UPI0009E4C338|nr:tRNA lysidine(34) synthetase TilS [Acinetobacter bereziniae]RSZ25289.1 tRNA lysidine(34) synthetase TilS [Acinetobacter bereziniae]
MRSTLSTFNEVWQRQFRSRFLKQHAQFAENTHFLIGCSGGMDSMLLLHLMVQFFPHHVRAIYVNHQLQTASDEWADFVAQQCTILQIPYIIQNVQVADGNLENQARQARYDAYLQHIKTDEVLVLAHHQQDQAETLILRLLSGAGVTGLSAMKSKDQREQLTIWRPLLDISREQICQWVQQLQIAYVNDPTNLDTQYDRAWCRHELWHILQSRYPKMQQALARTSYLMQDANEILNEVLQQDLDCCGNEEKLDLTKLKQLSLARQRQLLSTWMKGRDTYRPAFEMVQRLQDEVIGSKTDSQAALHWNHFYYLRYQNHLYRVEQQHYLAAQSKQQIPEQTYQFQLHQQLQFTSGVFQIERSKIGLSFALFNQKLTLKPRLGGEKIHLYGRIGAWPLKKAIQEAHIFPWMRHTIQILSVDNVMLGVFTPNGFWLAQSEYCEIGGWQPNLISKIKTKVECDS